MSFTQKPSLYSYDNYKTYIIDAIALQPNHGHGMRSLLAKQLKCNAAYISLVLNDDGHFSLEQAQLLNEFFRHSEDESHLFLLLVQWQRAGSFELQNYFARQIDTVKKSLTQLSNRIEFEQLLPLEQQAIYYSAWYYAAIHMALGIPDLRSPTSLQDYFKLPATTVKEVLSYLVAIGIAKKAENIFEPVNRSIHLDANSFMSSRSHAGWREKSFAALERRDQENFHYSSAVSMSRDDARKLRAIMTDAIQNMRKIISDSPEEQVYCYAMDLFCLKQ